MTWIIKHDINACIGCGACAAICPDNWEMDGGKAKPTKTELPLNGDRWFIVPSRLIIRRGY